MADDSSNTGAGREGGGVGGRTSSSSPVRPILGTRTTSELQRVRFSHDVERAEHSASPGLSGQVGTGDVNIDTEVEGRRSTHITSPSGQSAAPAALPPALPPTTTSAAGRSRDRGYSLRRALFTRTISQRSDTAAGDDNGNGNEIEIGESSSSRDHHHHRNAPALEDDGRRGRGARVSTINETETESGKWEERSSTSESRRDVAKKSMGESTRASQYNNSTPWGGGRKTRSKASTIQQKLKSYQTATADFIFRRTTIPPSKDGRHIDLDASRKEDLIDERRGAPYIGNTIRSSRYTLWDFIPRQLFFQFSKLANAYFLVVGILQLIPGLSTIGSWTTIAPLAVFVAVSMAKEGYDDFRRYRLDQIENRKVTQVFHAYRPVGNKKRSKLGLKGAKSLLPSKKREKLSDQSPPPSAGMLKLWTSLKWKHIKVGDIIRLERNDDVPADIVLLHATGPNGVAYIDTMALDGETNLKSKQASPCLSKRCSTIDEVAACRAHLVIEDPNIDLYNFDGKVTVDGETLPLTTNEVVFRGSTLRNTSHVIGMVINTGEDCKIRMNANKNPRIKAPGMQVLTNKIVVLLVVFTILLSVGCTGGYLMWRENTEEISWYLNRASVPIEQIVIGYVILFNTLIPLSLYVSLEIIKVGQLILMTDVEMYDPVSNTPMVCNTTTILENLGQVDYIFSDKTGTLTDNVMRFRKFSVAGYAWLHDLDLQKDAIHLEQKLKDSKSKNKGKGVAKAFQSKEKEKEKEKTRLKEKPAVENGTSSEIPLPPLRRSSSVWRSSARPEKQEAEYRTEDLLQFLQNKPHSVFTKKAKFFFLALALCHTCLPEVQENGDIEFQAASPDELALVKAAQDLGWLVIDRPSQSIVLKYPGRPDSFESVTETYQVLDIIEFSSLRKRMSIVVRFPNGKICILCKGADSAILPRLRLAQLALQKQEEITKLSSQRKSLEVEEALRKRSMQSPRNSYSRPSMSLSHTTSRKSVGAGRPSVGAGRPSMASGRLKSIRDYGDFEKGYGDQDDLSDYGSARSSFASDRRLSTQADPWEDSMIDEGIVLDDSAVFERCFQHIDDFASEGLRTLLYGYRFLDEQEYVNWKKVYSDATTSLVDRQDRIEAAGEMIEQDFDLVGATAIEDKLQKGVPETIDKLRRANIKIWMLTGDKRETAINIAYSARLAKVYSAVTILDQVLGDVEERMVGALVDINNGGIAHSVIVVDGQTLADISANEQLAGLFFDLVVAADSVICCRASPSQKASLVRQIRTKVKKSMTLAIGDGANDIAMIQEAHVGVGVSGKEGLQAARISDYSIAQFRFLQRLLFVHGRWNYVRTGKYILATFWKELLFYMVQAAYQKWNGYSGTSLFESTSLTVFNSLLTSLAVILLGIFEQDLDALTLLAVPELYSYGQTNQGFNFKKYVAWMFMAVCDAMVIYFTMWGLFSRFAFEENGDVLSIGTLCLASCVMFINIKCLIIEVHNKTIVPIAGCLITIGGYWIWNIALSAFYPYTNKVRLLYGLKDGFIYHHGRDIAWWLILILTLLSVIVFELGVQSLRKTFAPNDTDIFQVLQKDPLVRQRFKEMLRQEEEGYGLTNGKDDDAAAEVSVQGILNGAAAAVDTREQQQQQQQQDVLMTPAESHQREKGHGKKFFTRRRKQSVDESMEMNVVSK